jgi:hypothetical protein
MEVFKISLITFFISMLIQEPHTPLSWYGKLIDRLPWYLRKPIGGCYKCLTGEVFLWYFIFTKPFNIIELGFFISAGIFSAMIYNKIYCWLCK